MYAQEMLQFPEAVPSQGGRKEPRSLEPLVNGPQRIQDPLEHFNHRASGERAYTLPQVLQTYAYGVDKPDPAGEPGVVHRELNSIAHANLRRRIVVKNDEIIKTVLPRVPIPEANTAPKPKPSNTAARKRAQLAKKRARSSGGGQA